VRDRRSIQENTVTTGDPGKLACKNKSPTRESKNILHEEERTMTEEIGIAMKPEEAIREICSLQRKQNNEIKKLQEDFQSIQERITNTFDEINTKVGRELGNINDSLSSHITSTTTQMNLQLTNIQENVSELVDSQIEKIQAETKIIKEQNTSNWTNILKEIQEIKHSLTDARAINTVDERTQQPEHNQHTSAFITIPKDTQTERDVSSPAMSHDASSIHSHNVETNQTRIQTILLPAATTAPIFHGKPSERPVHPCDRLRRNCGVITPALRSHCGA
jgi:hypothetical protein